jgi:hypothetical protein
MKLKEYLAFRNHFNRQIAQGKQGNTNNDKAYIFSNAPYPIGSTVTVDDRGKKKTLVIDSYSIGKDGELIPKFKTEDNKWAYVFEPVIIG